MTPSFRDFLKTNVLGARTKARFHRPSWRDSILTCHFVESVNLSSLFKVDVKVMKVRNLEAAEPISPQRLASH